MMKAIKYFFGLLVGLGVGLSLGLLFAPQSGEKIRATLREKFDEVVEEGRRAAQEQRAQLQAEFQAAKEGH